MALPRTFVGFSSTDIASYRLMTAWKAHDKIDFEFCDCQLQSELRSEDEQYIKRRCRERINMAGTYILLIGADTRFKHKYVRWEAEVALEKQCRIIGVNLDGCRTKRYDLPGGFEECRRYFRSVFSSNHCACPTAREAEYLR